MPALCDSPVEIAKSLRCLHSTPAVVGAGNRPDDDLDARLRFQMLGRLLESGAVDVHKNQAVELGGEPVRDRRADALGGACYQSDGHCILPMSVSMVFYHGSQH